MWNVMTKDRMVDANFKKQLEKDHVYMLTRNILGNVICTYVSEILAR